MRYLIRMALGICAAVPPVWLYLTFLWTPHVGIKAELANGIVYLFAFGGAIIVGAVGGLILGAIFAQPLPVGLCVQCGYDIRATPLRCPECGLWVGDADGSI